MCVLFKEIIYFLSPFGLLYFSVLTAGSPSSECQHGRILVKALFQIADCQPFTVIFNGGRGLGSSLGPVLLIRALISFMRFPPS